MHRHTVYLCTVGSLAAALGLLFAGVGSVRHKTLERDRHLVATVEALQLTDLALWTEARYARNPALTDFFTPFQDLPGGPEHFPAGALIAPPDQLSAGAVR